MKKILYVLLALSTVGCGKVLDDIAPKGSITTGTLTEKDLGKLTNGVLYTMEGFVGKCWWDGDVMGEVFSEGPGQAALVDVTLMTPSTPNVLTRWQNCFTALLQINGLLESASSASGAAAENAKKTAYFCRALVYYNMATRWGNVPIVKGITTSKIGISPAAEVWKFVISDLNEALKHPSMGAAPFYVTDNAVKALLAKAYLWTGETSQAASLAGEVIASMQLLSSAESIAGTWCFGSTTQETIFSLANKRSDDAITLYPSVNDTDGSWNYSAATELYNGLYTDAEGRTGDIRRAISFTDENEKVIVKFPNGDDPAASYQFVKNDDRNRSPLVVLRLPEMYLVKAEAEGRTTGFETLKALLETRYADVSGLEMPSSDKAWEDLLLDEYLREFFGEGHRWFDLKRMNRLDKFKTLGNREYLMLWPIPQNEIDMAGTAAYPQNPGYAITE